MRSRNWVFTINNPDEDQNPEKWEGFKYLVFQLEKGESETPHYQGYITFNNKKSLQHLKAMYDATAHWEPRKGSHEQARKYCMKEVGRISGPIEVGIPPKKSGSRSDLEDIRKMIKSGATHLEIADKYYSQWVRYHRSFKAYQLLCMPQRHEKTIIEVIFGPTGTGKSRELAELYPNAYWKPNGKWWDGYEHQEHVVIDEFYGWLPYALILNLLDRYPLQLETKGGTVGFTSKYIHITTNQRPEKWYKKFKTDQLIRRIDIIKEKAVLDEPVIIHKDVTGDIPIDIYEQEEVSFENISPHFNV